jgi:hypothetical protein
MKDFRVSYTPDPADFECGCAELNLQSTYQRLDMGWANGTLCITGTGWQTRAQSTVSMIEGALKLLNETHRPLNPFTRLSINIGDGTQTACEATFAYSVPVDSPPGCKTRLIPDFSFLAWREAGLLPNFTGLVNLLSEAGQIAPMENKCGWAGNLNTNPERAKFADKADSLHEYLDLVVPQVNTGTEGGRISLTDQVKRWACLIDIQGHGYSGRLPLLLHSGRPVIVVDREGEHHLDRVWTAENLPEKLEAWKHYIPVSHSLADLEGRLRWVLDSGNQAAVEKIVNNAVEFARTYLTLDVAIAGLAAQMYSVAGRRDEEMTRKRQDSEHHKA